MAAPHPVKIMAFEVLDEHEQGELVRKWVRANAMSIIIGITIGLLLIFGFQQWKARQLQTQGEASTTYSSLVEATNSGKPEQIEAIAATLRKDFPKSPYAVLAALRQAEQAVEKSDWDAAAGHLNWAESAAQEPSMKSLIALRMARVELARDKADAALAQLDKVAKADYPATASELRGDVLLKLGRQDDARSAYEEALSHREDMSPERNLLEMKLGNLPASSEKQKS